MSPPLLTVPEKASRPPGGTGFGGQSCLTTSRGVTITGHDCVTLVTVLLPLQTFFAVAVKVCDTFAEHAPGGTTKLPSNVSASPGARPGTAKTGVLFAGKLPT